MRFQAKFSVNIPGGIENAKGEHVSQIKSVAIIESAVNYGDAEYQIGRMIEEMYPGSTYLVDEIKKVKISDIVDVHLNTVTNDDWKWFVVDASMMTFSDITGKDKVESLGSTLVFAESAVDAIKRASETFPGTLNIRIDKCQVTKVTDIIWAKKESDEDAVEPIFN